MGPACADMHEELIMGIMKTPRNDHTVTNDQDTPMLDWEMTTLARLGVTAILHDTWYDHEACDRAIKDDKEDDDGEPPEWPMNRSLRPIKPEGHARLVAVMHNHSRVGIPESMPEGTPASFEGMRAEPGDAIRVMLGLVDCEAWINTLLAYTDPKMLRELVYEYKGGHRTLQFRFLKTLNSMLRRNYDPSTPVPRVLFSWIRLLNDRILVTFEDAVQLSRFMDGKGAIPLDRIPGRMMRILRHTMDGHTDPDFEEKAWAVCGLYGKTVKDFQGNEHAAWSLACAQFALSQDYEHTHAMLADKGWLDPEYSGFDDAKIMVRLLTSPSSCRAVVDRMDGLLGEDTDQWIIAFAICALLFTTLPKLKSFQMTADWDWLFSLLSMAKRHNWERIGFVRELAKDNAMNDVDIMTMLVKSCGLQSWGLEGRSSLRTMDQPLHMLYSPDETLRGAKLAVNDRNLQAADFDKTNPRMGKHMGIMFMLSRSVYNIFAVHAKGYLEHYYRCFGRYELMVLLEDISHAYDKGVDTSEFDRFMVDLSSAIKTIMNDKDDDALIIVMMQSMIHAIVEYDPTIMHLPMDFVWNNPEMRDLAERTISYCRYQLKFGAYIMKISKGLSSTLPITESEGIPATVEPEGIL